MALINLQENEQSNLSLKREERYMRKGTIIAGHKQTYMREEKGTHTTQSWPNMVCFLVTLYFFTQHVFTIFFMSSDWAHR